MGRHLDKALEQLAESGAAAVAAAVAGAGHGTAFGAPLKAGLQHFDPAKHPRNRLGEFASLLAGGDGRVHLPSGVRVQHLAVGFQVIDRSGNRVKVESAHGTPKGGSARRAAALALRAHENGGTFPEHLKKVKGPGFFSKHLGDDDTYEKAAERDRKGK